MFSGACFLLILFTIPETHHSTILKHKAQRKRKDTGDLRWYAAIERRQVSSSALAKLILVRPWQVLFSEPMLQAITVYMSFIYGCLVSTTVSTSRILIILTAWVDVFSTSCSSRIPLYSLTQNPLGMGSISVSVGSCSFHSSSAVAYLA